MGTKAWVTLAVLSVVGAVAVGATGLSGQATAIDQPIMGRQLAPDGPLELGHLSIEPSPAAIVRELRCGEERCGIAISGPASVSYTVADPISVPVAVRNVKRASGLSPRTAKGAVHLELTLEHAVLWGWEVGSGLQPADGAADAEPEPPEWALRILDRPFFTPPSHDLLAARRLGATGVAYGLLEGDGETLLLNVDPLGARLETLYRAEEFRDAMSVHKHRWYLEELAAQPIGRSWWDRFPAPLVATHEAIKVVNDEPEHVTVTTTSTLQATRDDVGLWRVGLRQNETKHDKVLPNTVMSVTVDGQRADFLHRDSELLVVLDPPVARGAKVTVEVVNEGRIALQPGGDQYFYLGTWAWYPQPDWNGEFATVELELSVPEGWQPFASGNRVSLETADGVTTLKTALDRPVQFPVMAAGKYHVYDAEQDGHTCRVASYVFGKEKACERLTQNFFAAADFYGRLLGVTYPFEDFDVVEVNDWGFGQAPPGIVFITQEAFSPIGDYLSELFSDGVNERFVHEVAHTWWGTIVKQDAPEEQWIAEGFAEYSAALCLEAMRGGGKQGAKEMDSLINGWKARARRLGDGDSLYLANHLAFHDTKDSMDRWRLMYTKGPLVIHAIRLRLRELAGSEKEGDRRFVIFLSAVAKNFTFKWATTRDLIGILSQITGEDWQPFFDRYVFGTEMPKI